MLSIYHQALTPVQEPRSYFAFLETYDTIAGKEQDQIFIRFDCLTVDEAHRIAKHGVGILSDNLRDTGFIHIECMDGRIAWNRFFDHDKLDDIEIESGWFIIKTVNPRQELITATEFYNGAEQEPKLSLERLVPNDEEREIIRQLEGAFDLNNFGRTTEDKLSNLLNNYPLGTKEIVVTNVGQGNLNVLLDSKIPSIYFDLGGGTGVNKATYPTIATVQVCRTKNPLVILSHWDMDHVETAIRDSANCGLHWIVPLQKVGKTHYTLALKISNQGSLNIWPAGLQKLSSGAIEIIKCTGTIKNDSGLALIVDTLVGDALLPADAAYGKIPWAAGQTFSLLVTSHHGSKTASSNVPVAHGKGWIAYSYGNNNKFNHPNPLTEQDHFSSGWTRRCNTENGSIVFDSSFYTPPCGNINCDLWAQRHF